jgi:hypothetical protein
LLLDDVVFQPLGDAASLDSFPFKEKLPNCRESDSELSHLPIFKYCLGLEADSLRETWMSFGDPGTTVGTAAAGSLVETGVKIGLPRAHPFGVVEVDISLDLLGHSPIDAVETSNDPHADGIAAFGSGALSGFGDLTAAGVATGDFGFSAAGFGLASASFLSGSDAFGITGSAVFSAFSLGLDKVAGTAVAG